MIQMISDACHDVIVFTL